MNSDSTAIRSYVNDAPLPDVAPWRHRMNRAVDLAAFAVVKHFLSRARHHAFDLERTRDFAERWRDASVEDFYRIESFPASRENSSKLERTLRNARGRIELTLDSPLRTEEDRNNRFWLEFHLGHPIDRAPMFVILHGWRSVSVRGYHKMCGELNEMGVNAAVMHLPYHFSRRPSGTFNGELAISADLVRTGNGLRHGVMEMRWLTEEFKRLGAPAVGLWGTSYGGWIAALTALVEPRLDAVLMLEPPVDIETIFWEVPLFDRHALALERQGIRRESLSHLFDLATPHLHAPRIDPGRIVIIGSLYDAIATPQSLQRLHRAWRGSHLEIFPLAHISYRLHRAAIDLFRERLLPKLR